MKKQNVFRLLAGSRNASPQRCTTPVLGIVLALSAFQAAPAYAVQNNADTCDMVARIASNETGVPVEVLLAITRTETGRKAKTGLAPWPWTVNMEGKGVWFETRQKALSYAEKHFDGGARSFDVGCFQLNYRWHGQHFKDIAQMFEPIENARYAAEFLSRLYAETNSWDDAAAAYHSRTPEYADKYKKRYKRILANLPDPANIPTRRIVPLKTATKTVATMHKNGFPLLQKGRKAAALGSLVPLTTGAARPLLSSGG